jgi:hypothetical protein
VDRSGEPVLRQILEGWGKIETAHLVIERSTRARADEIGWEKDGTIDFWFRRPNQFRMVYNELFSSGIQVTSDGKQLLVDPLRWDGQQILRRPMADFSSATNELSARRTGSVFFSLLDGPSGFERMVSAGTTITATKGAVYDEIEFTHRQAGRVRLLHSQGEVKQIIVLALPGQGGLVQDVLTTATLNRPLAETLFSTSPHKGLPVRDETEN